jgi:hypothetical protein
MYSNILGDVNEELQVAYSRGTKLISCTLLSCSQPLRHIPTNPFSLYGSPILLPSPLRVPAPPYDNSLDYSARYCAQADCLTRTGVTPQEWAPPPPAIFTQNRKAPHDPRNAAPACPLCPILPYVQ